MHFIEAWHGWPCPIPGLSWLDYMPCVNRERKGFQGLSVWASACHLCLPLVCMATSSMANGVEGTAEYLPSHHYSVLASCHSWCYYPTIDWCRGSRGGFSQHCMARLHSTCLYSNSVDPALGLHYSAAASWVLAQDNSPFPSPRLGLGWSLPTCLLS